MATGDFARTKIQPPRARAAQLARDRLAGPLAADLAGLPVTLLCAPAGFGKSVLLAQQWARLPSGTALAWIAADADDDLARFAACLVAALDPHDLPWRVSPDALVAEVGSRPGAERAFAAELLNALAGTPVQRGLIAIDDLHRIVDMRVFQLIEGLVERLPPAWGLVLSARQDPPLPLARWRARGDLAEWRQDSLRFTADEVKSLATARGREDAEALIDRTEGWAAGLGLLLGASRADLPRSVLDRQMFDYLASEVLDQMPAELRDFLLASSVLPELSAARCAALTGMRHAAALLDEIDRRGLFVSWLDEAEPTLRLHDLFRDCLQDRLRRERPDDWPLLLQRAAAGEPDPVRRIGYLASAQAWGQAEAVLCEIGPELISAGAVPQVLRLVDQFPVDWQAASPALMQLRGLCAWAHWDWNGMQRAMSSAVTGYLKRNDAAMADHLQVVSAFRDAAVAGDDTAAQVAQRLHALAGQPLGDDTRTLLLMARSWYSLGNNALDQVAPFFSQVVQRLEAGAPTSLWFQCMPPTAFLGLPGIRAPLQRYVAGALLRAPQDPPSAMRVLVDVLQAGLDLFAGQVDAALARLSSAADDCRWLHAPPMPSTYLHTVSALAQALAGQRDAALASAQALLDGLDDERSSGRRRNWSCHYLYLRLRVAAIVDDGAVQREMAAQIRAAEQPDERSVFRRQRSSLPARIAALDGRWSDAAQGFVQALRDEVALDHYGQAAELRLRGAQALLHCGRIAEAAALAAPAFERALASGDVAGLRLAGPAALAMLADADWSTGLAPAHRQWLRDAAQRPAPRPAEGGEDGPLSQRELEVLARLAAGDSNKLIARALDLSPHTVKRHVANILDKLALGSRLQAANWYRQRGQ